MNGQYFIQTLDENRAKLWNDWFGTDRLPVLAPNPREWVRRGGAVEAFDVALAKLSEAQRNHFFGHITRETGQDYDEVKLEYETSLIGSVAISAENCIVLVESVSEDETAVQQRRPFLFALSWLARLFTPRLMYG